MKQLSALFQHKLVLVTGKGGIGKSVVSAALGQTAARSGARVLLVESAARDQLAPLFGKAPIGHVETKFRDNLYGINLEARETFREYVTKYLGKTGLFEKVFTHEAVQSFINVVPGLAELMLLGRLYYACEVAADPSFDLVIFDGFASGHFLSLMTTPEAVLGMGLGGPIAKETERVSKFLSTPGNAGIFVVTVPEELAVSECLEFLPKLAKDSPAKLAGVLVNRAPYSIAFNESSSSASIHELSTLPSSDRDIAGFLERRWSQAERAMQDLRAGIAAMRTLELALPLALLPDLGFIAEPLPPDFGSELVVEPVRGQNG